MELEDVVNWGFSEVVHQFGLNKGHFLELKSLSGHPCRDGSSKKR